ncbi:2'-5' RNA ligase family protein [Micromonospora purpureochromogenes]|uniref:2'-5' RNA ligase n=1 Tax=Micromonospora purpureochromogenes TaxID=47872 RepID=A0ABX2RE65_9ACTN|nr:2'-5' RNA ligase family protein [Micromonospora purpureochromogenes]NYF54798.1 2'-5' RNA ligase [Micromonospora purpureochromogenes]
MEPTQTALIVPIPEAEEAVGRFRASLDRAASWGVPAHVTVLYPFLPPQQINEQALAVLRESIAGIPRFDVALTHVDWFGDTVVWLAPQPDRPFRELTAAVWQQFPEAPPYAGVHSDVVPHLTIGDDAAKPMLSHAAETISAHLPINAAIDRVRLIAGTPDISPWRTVCEFPLGATPPAAAGTELEAVTA